jgi:cytosine/adenosine deaminase-related metal-dependent hydrolase
MAFRFWSFHPDLSEKVMTQLSLRSLLTVCLMFIALGLRAEDQTWAIKGKIVRLDQTKTGWIVYDNKGISKIHCKDSDIPAGAIRYEHSGYIFPTLIDTHNHTHWNAMPLWRANRKFASRYGWLKDPEYLRVVNDPYKDKIRKAGLDYAALKYGEIRAVIGGTCLIQSTYDLKNPEPEYLVRNLDIAYAADTRIPDITEIKDDEVLRFREGLATGRLRRLFFHIAEGCDDKCKVEFDFLDGLGLVRPGTVIIHGVSLTRNDFRTMAERNVPLVWSPKSNCVLYGRTADVEMALRENVTVALAPDWTITGSDNVLEEMKVAAHYSKTCAGGRITPEQIFRMVTIDAAKAAGVEERLGQIGVGFGADVMLAPILDPDPYKSLLLTYPQHLSAVVVSGRPVYGDRSVLSALAPQVTLEDVQIARKTKVLNLHSESGQPPHFNESFAELKRLLEGAVTTIAPLIEDDKD